MWLVTDEAKAQAAGADLQLNRVLYAVTAADMAMVYDDTVEEGYWRDLSPDEQAQYIAAANEELRNSFMNDHGIIQEVIDRLKTGDTQ